MKLELAILAGAESKQFLADFAAQIDRLEKVTGKIGKPVAVSKAAVVEDEQETEVETDDEDFAPAKNKKSAKAAASFEDEEEADEEEEAPKTKAKSGKKAKPAKITIDDVNDACKAYAEEHGFKATKALIKKKLKVDSINDLEEEQYTEVIALLKDDE